MAGALNHQATARHHRPQPPGGGKHLQPGGCDLSKIPRVLRGGYVVDTNQLLGKGSYGVVYAGTAPGGKKCAIKFETIPAQGNRPVLFYDQQFLSYLSIQHHCSHTIHFYDYSMINNMHYMVMDLCGPSLQDLFKAAPDGKFSVETTTMLALKMLLAINSIHLLKIVHRDIKPDNFLMGSSSNPSKVYITDFGLSKQFITMGQHIPCKTNKDLTGTARYVSINTHNGLEQSRRDDLEALSYVIIFFYKGGELPWTGIKLPDKQSHFKKIAEIKSSIDLNVLCKDCPEEMVAFIRYCRNLPFTMDPNYQYLSEILLRISCRLNFSHSSTKFDWDVDKTYQTKLSNELSRINYFSNNCQTQNFGMPFAP